MSARGRKKKKLREARHPETKRLQETTDLAVADSGPEPARSRLAYERLRHLYEIGKLLTRFEGVDRTIPAVVALVVRTLPLRSSIFLLETDTPGKPRAMIWQAEVETAERLRMAKAHAQASYAYLVRSGVDLEPDAAETDVDRDRRRHDQGPPDRAEDLRAKENYISLPLAVDKAPIFGALHLEGTAEFDELDLLFVDAVVNQVAIAVDRNSILEARHAAAEMARTHAEARRAAAERAEESIRGDFAFARDVTGSLGEGVVAADLEGRVTLFNAAAEQLVGFAADDAMGMRVQDVIQVRRADGTPLTEGESPFAAVMRRGAVMRSDESLFTSRGRAAFPVSYTCAPLRQAGQVSGAVLAFRDIIDIKRAEKEQRALADVSAILASSLRHREMLHAVVRYLVPLLADLCFIDQVGEDGVARRLDVVFADAQKQRDLAERVSRSAPLPGRETPQSKVLASGRSLLLDQGPELAAVAHDDEDAELLRATGTRSMMVVPLVAQGMTLGALTFIAAESDRRYSSKELGLAEEIGRRTALAVDNARLYEQAQRATRAREELLAVVSHDLKNPLGVILLNAAAITSIAASDDRRRSRKQVESIKRSADRMNRLIQDLLDTASIEAGKLSLERRRLAVVPLVNETIEAMQLLTASKSLHVERELPDELPAVFADAGRVQQVVANLLSNAVKFTPAGGRITVRAEEAGGAVRLSVADTGAGIPSKDLPHVFERFWQARRTARQGTGLGLSIVKGIVAMHGGRVWVESCVGAGSTFFVELPVAALDGDEPEDENGRDLNRSA